MRKLITADVFALSRAIKKIGLKEELKKISSIDTTGMTEQEVGYEIIFTALEKCSEKNAEKEIYEFLSKPFECTAKDVEKMELTKLVESFLEIADIEVWKNFLNRAVR